MAVNRQRNTRTLPSSIRRVVQVGAAPAIDQKIEQAGRTGAEQLADMGRETLTASRQIGETALNLPGIGLRAQYDRANAAGNAMLGFLDFQSTPDPTAQFEGVPMFDSRTGRPALAVAPPAPSRIPAPGIVEQAPTGFGGPMPSAPQRVPMGAKAGSDDLNTRMAGAQQRTLEYAGMINNYQSQIDELNRMQLAAIQEGATELARQYDEQINDLKGRLEKTKIAMARSMEAFKTYSEQVAPAYAASVEAAVAGQAAQDEAMAGRVENVEAAISGEFDVAVDDLMETADLIGAGEMVLSESLEGAMSVFEGMMKDAARGRIEDVDSISDAAALFAEAQSRAAKADDEFMTEIERETLEIQIQQQLDQLTEQIKKTEADKKRAVDAALAQYDPMSGFDNPDDEWNWAFQQYAMDQGWGFDEEELIKSLMGQMGQVANRAEALEWLQNEGEFASAHYDALETYLQAHYEGRDIPAMWLPMMDEIAAGGPSAGMYIGLIHDSIQDPNFTESMIAEMFRQSEADYDNVLDAFDLYESHTKKWNEARENLAGSGGGSEAVNNYANRNTTLYVRRRDVGVPTFAAEFQSMFGKTGTGRQYIGGVTSSLKGALRSPTMTGNGRSSNSDHLSGGALDLYGSTVAELEAIERWARGHPGVSLVVYSGNTAHETGIAGGSEAGNNGRGHVHVSLKIGYW